MKNMRSELPATSESATAGQPEPDTTSPAPRAGAAAKGPHLAGDAPGATVPVREAIGNWPDPM
jgi:hypothetical protein